MKRIIEILPAWDKRNEGYGIGGCQIFIAVVGEKGAYQFKASLPWYLVGSLSNNNGSPGHVKRTNWKGQLIWEEGYSPIYGGVVPTDVGYHAYKPQYEGQEPMSHYCELIGTDKCYYDGSSLDAEEMFGVLVEKGSEGVFQELEEYYKEKFDAPT